MLYSFVVFKHFTIFTFSFLTNSKFTCLEDCVIFDNFSVNSTRFCRCTASQFETTRFITYNISFRISPSVKKVITFAVNLIPSVYSTLSESQESISVYEIGNATMTTHCSFCHSISTAFGFLVVFILSLDLCFSSSCYENGFIERWKSSNT